MGFYCVDPLYVGEFVMDEVVQAGVCPRPGHTPLAVSQPQEED